MRDDSAVPVPTGAEGGLPARDAPPPGGAMPPGGALPLDGALPLSGALPPGGAVAPGEARPLPVPRPPARRDRAPRTYAALDLGTNNCRLLIAEPDAQGFRVVDAFSRIVRLGEGLGSGDRLSEDAIARTLDALAVCEGKMRARGVARARAIATEACRLAVNGPAFVARARREVGIALEVVDRRTEAFLAVTGCAALADPAAASILIFDIGGGSTEIAWLDGLTLPDRAGPLAGDATRSIRAWDSLPLGVVTLAERHGGADVTRRSFEGMVAEVASPPSRSRPPRRRRPRTSTCSARRAP